MVSGTSGGGNVKLTMEKYAISDGRHELLSKRTLVGRVSAKLIRQQMVDIFSVLSDNRVSLSALITIALIPY